MPLKSKEDQSKHKYCELDLIKFDYDLKRHKMRMDELKFTRETEEINHDNAMSRMRIKSAEIKRAFERKQASQYPRGKY